MPRVVNARAVIDRQSGRTVFIWSSLFWIEQGDDEPKLVTGRPRGSLDIAKVLQADVHRPSVAGRGDVAGRCPLIAPPRDGIAPLRVRVVPLIGPTFIGRPLYTVVFVMPSSSGTVHWLPADASQFAVIAGEKDLPAPRRRHLGRPRRRCSEG